jgi:hypothetical protein
MVLSTFANVATASEETGEPIKKEPNHRICVIAKLVFMHRMEVKIANHAQRAVIAHLMKVTRLFHVAEMEILKMSVQSKLKIAYARRDLVGLDYNARCANLDSTVRIYSMSHASVAVPTCSLLLVQLVSKIALALPPSTSTQEATSAMPATWLAFDAMVDSDQMERMQNRMQRKDTTSLVFSRSSSVQPTQIKKPFAWAAPRKRGRA